MPRDFPEAARGIERSVPGNVAKGGQGYSSESFCVRMIADSFNEIATKAKGGCPISRLLKANVTLSATLG